LSGGRYRVSETVLRRDSLSDFNDGCRDFAELRALILQARAAATNDADAVPAAGPDLDIEADELVMAGTAMAHVDEFRTAKLRRGSPNVCPRPRCGEVIKGYYHFPIGSDF